MNKEEILERSRREADEGVLQAVNLGSVLGMKVSTIIAAILIVINTFTGRNSHSIWTLYGAMMASSNYHYYKFNKKKIFFATAVCGVIVSVLNMIMYLKEVFGY